jgi:hypothetical protein
MKKRKKKLCLPVDIEINLFNSKNFQVEQHYGTEYHVDRIPEVHERV